MEGVTTMKKDLIKRLYSYSMFDGHLAFFGNSVNAALVVNMLEENQDYIEQVIKSVEEIPLSYQLTKPKIYTKDGFNRKQQLRLQTRNHPVFTKIRERIYINTHKTFDPHMAAMFDEEMLAIAFMADGSCYLDKRWENAKPNFRLHLNSWTYGDLMLFKKCCKDSFELEINTRKKGNRYDLAVPTNYSKLFVEIVEPYILPSFQYKLEQ